MNKHTTIIDGMSVHDGFDGAVGNVYSDSIDEIIEAEFNMTKANSGTHTMIYEEIQTADNRTLFKKVGANTTLLHGMQLPLMKTFDLPEYTDSENVDDILGIDPKNIDYRGDESKEYSYKIDMPKVYSTNNETDIKKYKNMIRKVFGYGFHIDGYNGGLKTAVLQNDVGFDKDKMIPFMINNGDDSATSDISNMLQIYGGRQVKDNKDGGVSTYYNFKKFQPNDIVLVNLTAKGKPISNERANVKSVDGPFRSVIKMRLKITKDELRDYFRRNGGVINTNYSGISLYSGLEYNINNKGCSDFSEVKVTNRANIVTQRLEAYHDASLIYIIYSK